MSDFTPAQQEQTHESTDPRDVIGKKILVLGDDYSHITLLDVMGSDTDIATAARVSYLGESKGADKDKSLIFRLMRDEHTSPFEMCEMKFLVSAPLVTYWQWVRHRTMSYSGQSGRYTEFTEGEFYIPQSDEWRLQSGKNKQGSDGSMLPEYGAAFSAALSHYVEQGYEYYQWAIENNIAREMARFFLPGFIVYYKFVIKTDLHNLLKFLRLRTAPDAQWEIRAYADAIYNEFAQPLFPWTCEAYEEFVLHRRER